MKKMNVAIIGAGSIAVTMANTIKEMDEVNAYAIASRSYEKAEQFAKENGFEKAYGSYEEMVKDELVDLVYIATPHSHHYEHAMLCIKHHKAVLCEKAFMVNAKQAEEVLAYAKKEGVLITEAIWTRYMPFLLTMKEVLASGVIGQPHMLTCNLGYVIDHIQRMQEPALAGGALLDLGVYVINFASMMFGTEIEKVTSACTYTKTGVDGQDSITITYKDGKMAVMNTTMNALSDRKGIIYGTKGFVIIENINNFQSMKVYDSQYEEITSYECPKQITGYEYEVSACKRALEKGELECSEMPHAETIRVMQMMDEIRKEWNIKYPLE